METSNTPAQRTALNIEVEFRRSYARDATAGTLKNISLTGAFLKHKGESIKVGEKLVVNFTVAGRERAVQATVVWTNSVGSGVRFQPTNNRDTQIVDDLIYYVESKREGTRGILDEILKKVA